MYTQCRPIMEVLKRYCVPTRWFPFFPHAHTHTTSQGCVHQAPVLLCRHGVLLRGHPLRLHSEGVGDPASPGGGLGPADGQRHAVPPLQEDHPQRPQVSQVSNNYITQPDTIQSSITSSYHLLAAALGYRSDVSGQSQVCYTYISVTISPNQA